MKMGHDVCHGLPPMCCRCPQAVGSGRSRELSGIYVQVRTATHCSTLQHAAALCNTLQHTTTHYNTLQHTATHSYVYRSALSGQSWLFRILSSEHLFWQPRYSQSSSKVLSCNTLNSERTLENFFTCSEHLFWQPWLLQNFSKACSTLISYSKLIVKLTYENLCSELLFRQPVSKFSKVRSTVISHGNLGSELTFEDA